MQSIVISNSSLKTFQTCPRKYHYTYIDERVPNRTSTALKFGHLIHSLLERWWDPDANGTWEEYIANNAPDIDVSMMAKAIAMVRNYNPPRDQFRVVGTEVPFNIGIPDGKGGVVHGVRLIGYADAILEDVKTGETVVRECKTTSEEIMGFGPFWERLAIDNQIHIYSMAFGASRVVYDVLKKPSHKITKADREKASKIKDVVDVELEAAKMFGKRMEDLLAKDPEPWFQWRELASTQQDQDEVAKNLAASVEEMFDAYDADRWPMYTGSCRTWGSCNFLDVCTKRADLWDDMMFCNRSHRSRDNATGNADETSD